MLKSFLRIALVLTSFFLSIHSGGFSQQHLMDSTRVVPLIPATATMETAWDTLMNPFRDSLPNDSHLAEQIKLGFEIFTDTPNKAKQFSGNKMACNNCHLNAGQKEKAMPLVGVAAIFPEYNKRSGRLFTLEDRIVECFMRSSNAARVKTSKRMKRDRNSSEDIYPTTHSEEVLALSAYITWLSNGIPLWEKLSWRGLNVIPTHNQIPLDKLDPKLGKELYLEKCVNCHGEDGQGVQIGERKAGPLWGPDSWNDGAGAARIYTLAGIIRYMMPYLDPGSLTDEEAQHISAFINSQPRPVFPFKEKDYPKDPIPADAVYYTRQGFKR